MSSWWTRSCPPSTGDQSNLKKTWLEIKWDSRLESGSLHLLHEVMRQRAHFDGNVLATVQRYTQINGFFAHEEPILLHLVCSDNPEDMEVGVRHILRIRRGKMEVQPAPKKRRSKKVEKKVRKYKPRDINWNATSVDTLIDLSVAS